MFTCCLKSQNKAIVAEEGKSLIQMELGHKNVSINNFKYGK